MNMNIGLVIISVPGGGAETVVYELQKYLSKKGHNVVLIANEEFFTWDAPLNCDKINLKKLLDPNFLVKGIFGKNLLPTIPQRVRSFVTPTLLDMYFSKKNLGIKREIINKKIDVLHFHDPYGLKLYKHLSKVVNIPCVYTFHGKNIDLPFYFIRRKKSFVKIVNSIDEVTTVSEPMRDYLILNGVKPNINVIHNGVDLKMLSKVFERKQERKNKGEFRLIFPGGDKEQKGGRLLLEALEKIRKYNIKLFYCGKVNDTFINKYQMKKVIFTGLLPRYKYLELLSRCDCLILLSRWEASSISIMEAMALGKTVITTEVGGITKFFNNYVNGLFVERNSQDVADKIVYLYKNQELQKQISIRNLQDVKKFDWAKIVNKYIKLYEKAL